MTDKTRAALLDNTDLVIPTVQKGRFYLVCTRTNTGFEVHEDKVVSVLRDFSSRLDTNAVVPRDFSPQLPVSGEIVVK